MDPHSRLSQYNQRTTKLGPEQKSTRHMDSKSTLKRSSDPLAKTAPPLFIRRPIASNSRVKLDEKHRKDLYLSFLNNALQQKSEGNSELFDELVHQFNPPSTASPEDRVQPQHIRLWIVALTHVVSRLERNHSSLVEAIVNMPWTTLDALTVKEYTVFIGLLLSARPEYLTLVLAKVTRGFTYQSGLQAMDSGVPEGFSSPLTRRLIYDRLHYLLRHLLTLIPTLSSTLLPLLVRNFPHKRQSQVCQATYIRNLLRISGYCPQIADKILATIIDRAIQIDVEIQVEMEEIEEESLDQEMFDLDPFDVVIGQDDDSDSDSDDSDGNDNFSDLSSDGGDLDDVDKTPEISTDIKHIQEMVKKLDAILALLFDHFQNTHSNVSPTSQLSTTSGLPPLPSDLLSMPESSPIESFSQAPPPTEINPSSTDGSWSPETTSARQRSLMRTQFHCLLSIFDRAILRTFKSRYTQFLLFWFTSLDPEFSDLFQGMLVDRALFGRGGNITDGTAQNNDTPAVTRAAAASYIGSFVSRATFVDREGARRVMKVLCEFLRLHLETVEQHTREGSVAAVVDGHLHNNVFYAVTQAVFLIFCFRWRDLLEDNDPLGDEDLALVGPKKKGSKKWMAQLGVLQRVITSILNPLKVCSTNVVTQFARVAHATDFIYCYSILEANKRAEYGGNTHDPPSDSSSPRRPVHTIHSSFLGDSVNADLNAFFPFDPYRLPKSNAFIQPVYREWASVAIDEDDEDDEEEDAEDEDEVEDADDLQRPTSYLDIPQKSRPDDFGLGKSLGAMSISPVHPLQMQSVGRT